ncbi:MAG: hypothetical protein K1X91_02585 [Bacteriodetes bacterium]|nr:hypothetical protein [Bacteroidota bacterium]
MANIIIESSEKQVALLRRIVKLLFAVAGCMWLVKYILQFPSETTMQAFVIGQYQLYLVLLTLWGYDYKRETGRYKALQSMCKSLNTQAENISTQDIHQANAERYFVVLTKRTDTKGGWFTIIFTWTLTVAAVVLITRQLLTILSLM